MAQQPVVQLDDFRGKARQEPKVILVVEDDETMRNALERIFQADGYIVKAASDGTELAKVLDDQAIDLIALDVGLPWIDGYELATLIKEHSDLKTIPLIFISGQTSDDDIKKGFDVGANDFIKKLLISKKFERRFVPF